MKEMEKKSFKLEIKATSIEGNIGKFDGYAAIFNKLDFNNDIILPGSFKRSLDLQGDKRPLYFEHIPHKLLGAGFVQEDENGLKIDGEINLDTQIGKETFSNMQKGYLDTMSIGYMTVLADFIGSTRYLKEMALWEVTLTTLPAMPDARVEAKSVVPYQDLPMAPEDTVWDAVAATSRVAEWAGGPDKEKIDWGKYKKAFLWFDEANPTKLNSYKLPFADIIDGKLKAVPEAFKTTLPIALELKPYPNEHSCRLEDPKQFVRCFRKTVKDSKDIDDYTATNKELVLIICYDKDENSKEQAFRYKKDEWTAEQAKKHCKAHGGTFEAAKEEKQIYIDESEKIVNISSDDRDQIKEQLKKYYKKMGIEMLEKASLDLKMELKAGRTISQATAAQIQSSIDVLKGILNIFTEVTATQVSKAIDTLEALLSDTGAKSLLTAKLAGKETDTTLSALINDIKKFT